MLAIIAGLWLATSQALSKAAEFRSVSKSSHFGAQLTGASSQQALFRPPSPQERTSVFWQSALVSGPEQLVRYVLPGGGRPYFNGGSRAGLHLELGFWL